ncbi:MAG TPA: hypothetical protein VGL16_02105, partial [Actinomycetota bacterium]
FEDFTHVKFYRRSLYDGVLLQGARFDGFSHVEDWVPQRLVTATGPNRSRGDRSCATRRGAPESRSALVTGASGGVGAGIARRLGEAGAPRSF